MEKHQLPTYILLANMAAVVKLFYINSLENFKLCFLYKKKTKKI